MLRNALLLAVLAVPGCARGDVTDAQIGEVVAGIAAAEQQLPVALAYRTCPALFEGKYKIDVTIPLQVRYGISAAGVVVAPSPEAIELTVPTLTVQPGAVPDAFDDSISTGVALNKADGKALVEVLAGQAGALSARFASPATNPELTRGLSESLAALIAERTRQLGDTRPVTVHLPSASANGVQAPALDLCEGSSLTASFPAAFPESLHFARGSFPVGESSGAQTTMQLLRNAGGKVIAYREVDARLASPVGTFQIVDSPPDRLAPNGSAGTKIIGGTEVADGRMPWAVAFARKEIDGGFNNFCGGTLIAANWVVTAAHCRITPDSVAIVARTDIAGTGGFVREVKQVWRHIEFGKAQRYDADIALVRLASDVTAKVSGMNVGALNVSTPVIVVGWGATVVGGRSIQKLHEVELEVAEQGTCRFAYADEPTKVTANMFCASKPNKDACQGDSGGGSYVRPRPNVLELVGIVSFGKGCAEDAFPGVYTRLASYKTWVDEVREAARAE